MKNNEAQQIETMLSDDALALATGGVEYVTIGKATRDNLPIVRPQGPVFPDVEFGYETRPFKDPR